MGIGTSLFSLRVAGESDLGRLVEIETFSGEGILTKADFRNFISVNRFHLVIVNDGHEDVAFCLYEMGKKRLHIVCCVVDKQYRRKKIGTYLFDHLAERMRTYERDKVIVDVRESDLGSQLFLRTMGYKCVKILRNWLVDNDGPDGHKYVEDAYRFRYEEKC